MSSKRSLYKPAPESGMKSTEKMGSRKPLIQGRLVSSVLPDSMTVFASPSSINQPTSWPSSRDSPVITATYEGPTAEGSWTPPRQAMARYSPTGQVATAQLGQIGRSSPPPSSVGSVPRSLGPQSPPKPSPSRALDLSDSEVELHANMHTGSRSVLMVDASGARMDPEATEVMVHTGMVSSPAKVVCHMPSEGQEPDPRDTGSVDLAAKIAVDHVPSAVVQGGDDQQYVVTEEDHADDTIPTRGPPAAAPSSAKKLAFEDTDEVGMSDTRGSLALKDSLVGRSRSKEDLRAEKDSSTHSVREKRKKKSNRSHFVPSRYMESANKASLNTTDSRITKTSEKLMKKPPHKPPALGQPSTRAKKPKSRKSMMPPVFSETPMDRGAGGKDMFTSTPAIMDGSFFPANASNISSIGCDLSVLREDPTADLGSRLDETAHRKGKKGDARHPRELTQFDLDKMHARYMQWVFLESKMRKVKQEKEKETMSQLYLLHQENERLSQRKAELELKLSRLIHANELDQLLDIQKSGLGPVGANLGQFGSQFTTLAEALDTTRHQVTTTGIHLPQNQEHFQDELLSALSESEQLLTGIHSKLQERTTKTSTFAKTLQALNKTVEAEDEEIKRCQQLLTKSSINAAHETSLRVQQIEGRLEE